MIQASKGVFLSYASEDAGVAKRICEALRTAGIEVWFDQSELRGGDAWDQKIRQQIQDCALFVPIVSAHTQARPEGYFRLEWKLAVNRSHLMAAEKAFLMPVVVDATTEPEALVPAQFREVQWTRMQAGVVQAAFVDRIATLLNQPVVRHVGSPERGASHPPKGRLPLVLKTLAGAAVVALGIAAAMHGEWLGQKPLPKVEAGIASPSVAVLPFVDMSEKKDQEYFADGMAEELLDVLVRIPSLKVIGRTSSFQFKGHNEDLRVIGSKLGAAYVVEGSVRKAGPRIRVTAQLIDTHTGVHLWADSYDRDFGDVLTLQDQIATSIARALQLTVEVAYNRPAQALRSTEAYTLYLRGRSAYERGTDGLRESQRNFEQALELDPLFLRAAERLALAYAAEVQDSYAPSGPGWQRVREAANKALHIDPASPVSHTLLGMMHGEYEYDWAAAESEFNKSLASRSRDSLALDWTAGLAFDLRHRDQAMKLIDTSLSTDPLNPDAWNGRAGILAASGDIEGAESAYRKCLEISPAWTEQHLYVGQMLLLRGKFEAALAEAQLATPYDGRDIDLAMIYHALGRKSASDAALARLKREYGRLWPHNIAQVYAYRGELDQALEWLDKSYAMRNAGLPSLLRDDPTVARLRTDPRYKVFLHKLNLTE